MYRENPPKRFLKLQKNDELKVRNTESEHKTLMKKVVDLKMSQVRCSLAIFQQSKIAIVHTIL